MSTPTYAERARALVSRWLDGPSGDYVPGPYKLRYGLDELSSYRIDLERRIADALRRAEQKVSKERGR